MLFKCHNSSAVSFSSVISFAAIWVGETLNMITGGGDKERYRNRNFSHYSKRSPMIVLATNLLEIYRAFSLRSLTFQITLINFTHFCPSAKKLKHHKSHKEVKYIWIWSEGFLFLEGDDSSSREVSGFLEKKQSVIS